MIVMRRSVALMRCMAKSSYVSTCRGLGRPIGIQLRHVGIRDSLGISGMRGFCSSSSSDANCHHIRRMQHKSGADVYLVGVVHGQHQSEDEVRSVIQSVKPQVVVVELGPDSLREYQEGEQKLTGAAEMRIAIEEAEAVGARLVAGDRGRTETMEAVRKVVDLNTFWGLMNYSFEQGPAVFVESLKQLQGSLLVQREQAERVQKGLAKHMPEIYEVIVTDRNIALFSSIQRHIEDGEGQCVVAVFGAAHLSGIERLLMEHEKKWQTSP